MDWSNRLTFTVTELNEYVKKTLEAEPLLRSICLRGEVNGVKKYPSGTYFTLKDEGAAVSAVIWRSNAMRLKTPIRDGMRVTAQGYVTLYVERGQYQFTCVDLQPEGQGDLYARFLELKDKLGTQTELDFSQPGIAAAAIPESHAALAMAALGELGYSQSEIGAAMKNMKTDGLSTEEIVRQALRAMVMR